MDAEILRSASYICYAISGIFFVLAVVLFFTMRIKEVLYELSGKAKVATTQRMNDSFLTTGSLRTSANLTGSLSGNISKPTSANLNTTGKTKPDSGNIRKTGNTGKMKGSNAFRITKDIVIVHTNERIS